MPNLSWSLRKCALAVTRFPGEIKRGLDEVDTLRSRALKLKYSLYLCFLILATPTATTAQSYQFTDLGTLGGAYSAALGINGSGQVVGFSYTSEGTYHAFLYSDGKMRDLGTLGGENSFAYRISENGHVAGLSENRSGGLHAFVYYKGVSRDLGAVATGKEKGITLNRAGRVISFLGNSRGDSQSQLFSENSLAKSKELFSPGAGWMPIEMRGSNTAGQLIGYGYVGGSVHSARKIHAFLLTPYTDLSTEIIASSSEQRSGTPVIFTNVVTLSF